MNRKWWSFLIPAMGLLWPTDSLSATTEGRDRLDLEKKLVIRKIDFKYFFSFNRQSSDKMVYEVRHSSHSSHRSHSSHSSHSSHVSGSGISSYSTPAPSPAPLEPTSPLIVPMTATGQIIADANLRSEASSEAKILQLVKKGLLVEIKASSGSWFEVSFLANDIEVVGWVNSSLVKLR